MATTSTSELIFLKAPKDAAIPAHLAYLKEPIEQFPSYLPDGRINTKCPCLESAFAHRCGYLMREAIACFNHSKSDPRGAECESQFVQHALCIDNK
ncbi:unnamed protein product, partial [Mesorhabditis spiculigera]